MRYKDQTKMGGAGEAFLTTYWSLIDGVNRGEDRDQSLISLLLHRYWKPVYCLLRHKGYANERAKDLTQEFFHEVVLNRSLVSWANPAQGRFRSFLLHALDHFLIDCRRKESAKYGEDHPTTLWRGNRLAVLRTAQTQYAEAESLLTRVIEGWTRTSGEGDPNTLRAKIRLSRVYMKQTCSERRVTMTKLRKRRCMSNTAVMKRREFMRLLAAGAMGLGLSGCRGINKAQTSALPQQPNIVYIIADDMGWRDIGYQGSEIRTPNLDRLARAGRIFEQHYVMPTCTPTRVGLLSGQYPSRYGILGPDYGKIYDDDTVTLAEVLKRKGYATHISGKWHMGSPPEYTPMKYGFTSSYGYFAGQIDPYTHRYKTGIKTWHRNDQTLDEPGHATDLITDDAVRVIKSDHEQPFFLYVAYSVPHSPLKEPEAWLSLYPDIEEPSRRWFAASVTHMDDGIGNIVDALDKTGMRKDTLLVFVSDNGGQESWRSETQYDGDYAKLPHTVLGNNLPLRDWKGDCYEGGIRVPAFVNWPGQINAGRIESPVHIVDWMPTLCHLAGAELTGAQPCDGQDIWPQIMGATDPDSRRTLYWKTSKASAVRQGDWKLILFKKDGRCELFNLADDPHETHDLADQERERVLTLKAVLSQIASRDQGRVS